MEAPERIRLYYDHDAHEWRESRQTNVTGDKPEYVLALKLDQANKDWEHDVGPKIRRIMELESRLGRIVEFVSSIPRPREVALACQLDAIKEIAVERQNSK